jgi:DNA excision repair protein ERCC-3
MDLTRGGFLARVECVEVRCPMAPAFMQAYLQGQEEAQCLAGGGGGGGGARRGRSADHALQLLYETNFNKLLWTRFLVRWHEARGDKILVFCSSVATIRHYAAALGRPYLYGESSEGTRSSLLKDFRRRHGQWRTLVLSAIGDVAIDLPEATVRAVWL